MKEQQFILNIISSIFSNEASKINCISRTDKDKNLEQEIDRKRRWNLYTQIAIENGTLRCSTEVYNLTKLCSKQVGTQPCTLLDTNEVVDIGFKYFGGK